MKWLRRRFRRRHPERVSRLERQVRLGLLQDAMGRAEERQHDPWQHDPRQYDPRQYDPRQARNTDERNARSCPVPAGVAGWLGSAEG